MNRHDRLAWRGARTLADVGTLTASWLRGDLTETPGHGGPPEDETVPLIPLLSAVNHAGFITDCSQPAEAGRDDVLNTAWVDGFSAEAVVLRLRDITAGTLLVMTACHGRHHEHAGAAHLTRCLRREVLGFYRDCCPQAAGEIRDAWYVSIEDPEPGRNDRLWPALADFAGMEMAA